MVLVRRRRGHDQSAPHDERTENVGEGFDGVRDERVRMADNARGEFRISFWRFGPTELRILLAVGNLALFWKPVAHIFGGIYRLFDVGGTIGLAGMGLMVVVFTLQNTIRLYREESIPQ